MDITRADVVDFGKAYLKALLPCAQWLPHYSLSKARNDLIAGARGFFVALSVLLDCSLS